MDQQDNSLNSIFVPVLPDDRWYDCILCEKFMCNEKNIKCILDGMKMQCPYSDILGVICEDGRVTYTAKFLRRLKNILLSK